MNKASSSHLNKNKEWVRLVMAHIIKVVNSFYVGVLFFQLKWNVSVLQCFDILFRGCTVHIYIYIFNKHNSNLR